MKPQAYKEKLKWPLANDNLYVLQGCNKQKRFTAKEGFIKKNERTSIDVKDKEQIGKTIFEAFNLSAISVTSGFGYDKRKNEITNSKTQITDNIKILILYVCSKINGIIGLILVRSTLNN